MTTANSLPRENSGDGVIVSRAQDGVVLFRRHGDLIISSFNRGIWLVPSRTREGLFHFVVLRGGQEYCSCEDCQIGGETCAHIHAATIAKAKSATCDSCKKRFRHADLFEVLETPSCFEGALLCTLCVAYNDARVS